MSKLVIPGVIAQTGNGGGGGDIPDNVYTQDNLVAGTNISITEVPRPIIDDNTVELYHCNGDMIDTIANHEWTTSANQNKYSYPEGKFSQGVRKTQAYDDAGNPLNSFDANIPATIDFWICRIDTSVYMGFKTVGGGDWNFYGTYVRANNTNINYPSGITLGVNEWHHIAIVNDGLGQSTSEKYYIDGKLAGSKANNGSFGLNAIGQGGIVDEIRISNVARWTADFTPFSQPYQEASGDPVYQINNTQDMSSYLQNTATNSTSIVVNNKNEVISSTRTTVIGNNASTKASYAVVIGDSAEEKSPNTIGGIAIGQNSLSYGGVSIGIGAKNIGGVAIGHGYSERETVEATATGAIAIGNVYYSSSSDNSVKATATNAIQLGNGTNSNAKTLQVYEWPLLDGNTGKIFSERLPSGNSVEVTDTIPTPSSSNVGQVKLYSGTTTSDFTNGYLYQCKLESTTSETVTFDSDKVVVTPEIFWLIVKLALPETYSNVTNGYITYNESANLVTFTFKDASGNTLGEFPADVGEISAIGITFNNLVDGDVINFTCSSGIVESYKWELLIVQESSEIKVYNATSWSENTTLFPNRSLLLPNVDDLTNAGLYRVKFNCSLQNVEVNLDYLCQVSAINANGTILGHFQTLQVFYPSLNDDRGISVTLYRSKQTGSTWSDWKSSLVTSVSNNSTDVEYVSAKLFYDTCGNIEALINAL